MPSVVLNFYITMDIDEHDVVEGSVLVQMCNEDGESTGPPLDVPLSVTAKQLQLLCNSLLENVRWLFWFQELSSSVVQCLTQLIVTLKIKSTFYCRMNKRRTHSS